MLIGAAIRAARNASKSRTPAPQHIPLTSFDPPSYAPYSSHPAPTQSSLVRDRDEDTIVSSPPRGHAPPVKPANLQMYTVPLPTRGRTPSPTPSEAAALTRIGRSSPDVRALLKRRYIPYWIAGAALLTIAILFVVFQSQIINALQPATRWMHGLKVGWLIPVAVMIVLSFPPLFGHEIVAILVGVVWGLGEGFGIVAAGTFLGELLNFFAFKWCCKTRADKFSRGNLRYASLSRAIQDGGFPVVLVARYSVIPGHLLTAVFSTCGMPFWVFCASAILGMGKQLVLVYMGVALEEENNGGNSKRERVVKVIVLVVTIFATMFAMRFMRRRMDAALVKVVYERRKMRQEAELQQSDGADLSTHFVASMTAAPAGIYDTADKPSMASSMLPALRGQV